MHDVIIIGSGAGGATLARTLATGGRDVLILERGEYVPKEPANSSPKAVFADGKYTSPDEWLDRWLRPFAPQAHYNVGGATKFYGAALYRLRPWDFTAYETTDGYSPAWPLTYEDMQPWYEAAERMYRVHGDASEDTTSQPRPALPYPALAHSPGIQKVSDALSGAGYHPFHAPAGVDYGNGACIRCNFCDGFACQYGAKADAETVLAPVLGKVTLITGAEVKLINEHQAVTTDHRVFNGRVIVLSAGAVNSAAILLRSHLGNDMVGRNYMCHNSAALMTVMPWVNDAQFEKTLAVGDWLTTLGSVQMMGKSTPWAIRGEAHLPKIIVPDWPLEKITAHALDWWLMSEDTPVMSNRVRLLDGQIQLSVDQRGQDRLHSLRSALLAALRNSGLHPLAHGTKVMPLAAVAHQAGTARFGTDPATSVLDTNCMVRGTDSVYVVDASFMPSVGSVNPALTIAANALRVGAHLKEIM